MINMPLTPALMTTSGNGQGFPTILQPPFPIIVISLSNTYSLGCTMFSSCLRTPNENLSSYPKPATYSLQQLDFRTTLIPAVNLD
eukprot:scaffold1697_cov120-Cylindrotheca_fusiformis.AAC.11